MESQEETIRRVAGLAKIEDSTEEECIQLVIFDLDDEEHAIKITDLQEIILMADITPVPGTPDFIRGIFNLRGRIIVAIDLEKRFGLTRITKKEEKNIIIAESNGNNFGIIVDKVTEILKIPVSSLQPVPAISSAKIHTDYLKGIFIIDKTGPGNETVGSRLIALLDLPKILEEKELTSLGAKAR